RARGIGASPVRRQRLEPREDARCARRVPLVARAREEEQAPLDHPRLLRDERACEDVLRDAQVPAPDLETCALERGEAARSGVPRLHLAELERRVVEAELLLEDRPEVEAHAGEERGGRRGVVRRASATG